MKWEQSMAFFFFCNRLAEEYMRLNKTVPLMRIGVIKVVGVKHKTSWFRFHFYWWEQKANYKALDMSLQHPSLNQGNSDFWKTIDHI